MLKRLKNKKERQIRRANKTRSKVVGTKQRPRLSVFRSLNHISAQIIDDTSSNTLVSVSDKEIKSKGTKLEKATEVGKLLAKKGKDAKISKVVFDKGSYKFHGRVKAIADAARDGGIEF